ncbi:hypothetical protein [Butyrivibrio hungatei]|uniref:Uncharacterized protein n=1 Tax=Butyrivibrio hungatei TaxID=185008 RepID=A0A1D9P6N6_9FIRM|nr:hypothetical protein [Butyrivibrio hungatei]AOZ97815.1 hypothetical protein bhn_II016 [Butyrivibrio hungatei]
MIAHLKRALKDSDRHHLRGSNYPLGTEITADFEIKWLGRLLCSVIEKRVGNIGEENDEFHEMWDNFVIEFKRAIIFEYNRSSHSQESVTQNPS